MWQSVKISFTDGPRRCECWGKKKNLPPTRHSGPMGGKKLSPLRGALPKRGLGAPARAKVGALAGDRIPQPRADSTPFLWPVRGWGGFGLLPHRCRC
jgi:hypothetical protein